MGKVNHSSQAKLFRRIVQTKCGEHLCKNGGLSYTRLRKLLLEKLSKLGFDLAGMHSLLCHAAGNTGIEDRLFKRHGRWKSESAKDSYVKDSPEHRLGVSKGLGICFVYFASSDVNLLQCSVR